ncbi:unnamed protein product [Closterium sp. NIES-53]
MRPRQPARSPLTAPSAPRSPLEAPHGPALSTRGPVGPRARPRGPERPPPKPSRAALPEPSRATCTGPSCPTCLWGAPTDSSPTTAIPLTAPMASPPVLAFDAEGRLVKFDTWLDDLHLFLQLTAKEDISLYDHALGHATAPAATADSTARSQWQTRDAHARFAIRNSLPIDEREHFGQHKTAQALYTAVVARYSSQASAALGRLSLPYLFPDLASFHTVADLITHLRTTEARFRAAMPDEFLAKNPPPLWLTLYHLVTRLPDTLRSVRDHFLARCPTELTIALLEKELLAAETSIVAVGASRGDPRTPFFEGCSPSPLLPSVASAAAVDLLSAEKGPGVVVVVEVEGPGVVVVVEVAGLGVVVIIMVEIPRAPPRRELPSRDQIRAWYERRCTLRSGAPGVTDPGATGAAAGAENPRAGTTTGAVDSGVGAAAGAGDPGVGVAAGVEDPGVGAATGAEDPGAGAAAGAVESSVGAAAGAWDPGFGAATGAEDPGVGAAAGAEDPGTGDSAGSCVAARRRPYFVPLLQQTGPTGGLTERREPASRPASPVRAARTSGRGSRQRPPPVPGTHRMSLRPSTAPLRAPLPSPPESSLPALSDPESDFLRAASPTVARLLATVVTDPSFESTAASALVAELVDFAACCRLDYAASLVAESESVCPPSVGGECALGTDVLEDRQEEFQCLAAASPHLVSVLLTPEGDPDALDIPTPRSYAEAIEGTYVDAVPPLGANIVSGMWIFRVKRPPSSPPVLKARYVVRGFSRRQGVDYFQTFSPTPKMTTLRVLLHVAAHRDYELHSLDFSTAFLQGSLHKEIWLRRPPGFTRTSPVGTQWSLRRPVYGLRQAPRKWHDTLRTTLAALGFAPSTANPSLFLRTDTSLPPFYILVYVDDLVFATADTAGLAYVNFELQKRHTCTDLGELCSYLGLQITRDRARRTITLTQSHMVQQVLQRFDFTYSSPQATPLPTRHSLSSLPSDESVESSGSYPELVGCLMYLMTCTRPDLAYPLSILARYVAPGRHRPEHMTAAKRVLRYLCSTSGMGLVLGGQSPVVLTGHADASWADDQATQRSSQGYTFSLGAMATQELRWLTYLLTDL